jgi:hypothetical protein
MAVVERHKIKREQQAVVQAHSSREYAAVDPPSAAGEGDDSAADRLCGGGSRP